MKKMFITSLVLFSTALAHASSITLLSTDLPATDKPTTVKATFHIATDMKEAYAQVSVEEQITTYVQNCTYYGSGYFGPGNASPGNTGYGCHMISKISYRPILSEKIKIKAMTMNGDDVIYQGRNGDVICGSMRSSTFYPSSKCELSGKIVSRNGASKLSVTFTTK